MAYTKYSLTPANNTAAPPDGAPEGMLPSAVNDTMRDMMAQIRDVGDGIRDGTYTMTAPKITGGTITGSTINNSAIGGTTAAAGAFTTLSATGATTFSGATVVSGSLTANTFSSSGATITGGTINNTAIGGTTATTGAFTTSSLKGSTSGVITLNSVAVAGTNTATFPAATGTVMVSGNMPAFSAYNSASTSLVSGTNTKVLFATEDFDTNNNFASSTFTPTVAGYYQLNSAISIAGGGGATEIFAIIYKNGSAFKSGADGGTASFRTVVSSLVYANGTTDYFEIYCYSGAARTTEATNSATWFNGCLVRSA